LKVNNLSSTLNLDSEFNFKCDKAATAFIQDGRPSSKPIDQLFNKVWWFSLTFEG